MRITGISIQKYRSIRRTNRLNLDDMTVLVGPNNEGKSNILRALATSMQLLRAYSLTNNRASGNGMSRLRSRSYYDWESDFPKDLQEKSPDGNTIIDLWFDLDSEEQAAFQKTIRSKLRTELPIRLTIGRRGVEFSIRKQGPGGATLTSKADKIAYFIGRSLRVEYVASVRTASEAQSIVRDMVQLELLDLQSDERFYKALTTLESAIQPVVEKLSRELTETLRDFLPDVLSTQVQIATDGVLRALAEQTSIVVDDGVPTDLKNKGDGVQSLAALALMRKAAEVRRGSLFLAIEEPEAHLHPRAIHQLRTILTEIASTQQVVLTTHSPVLVNRQSVEGNILVRSSRASSASSVQEIRDTLGVRVSDNLSHASLVLIVEGGFEQTAVTAIIAEKSTTLRLALESGMLAVESIGGASNLLPRLESLRNSLCRYHALLDNDTAGQQAAERARAEGLLSTASENFVIVKDLKESEFEDVLDPALYQDSLRDEFGVTLAAREFRNNKAKWSTRVENSFRSQGKNWDKKVKVAVKTHVANRVAAAPGVSLHPHRSSSISSLIEQLELRLSEDRSF